MQKKWTYKNYEIQEGLKPGSTTFRYFFVVSEKGMKKSNYCVWIKDDALSRFDQSKNFDTIISSQRENWGKWIKEKIDAQDFQNRALKFDKMGKTEINLSEMNGHVTMDQKWYQNLPRALGRTLKGGLLFSQLLITNHQYVKKKYQCILRTRVKIHRRFDIIRTKKFLDYSDIVTPLD